MDAKEIQELRILSSIPTNSVDKNEKFPKSMGSGCFIDYAGHTIFLTVYHTINDQSLTFGIVSDFAPNKGALLLTLGLTPPIIRCNLFSSKIDIIDFSYKKMAQMPKCKYFVVDNYGNITSSADRIMLSSKLTDSPTFLEEYGFAGYIYGHKSGNPIVGAKIQNIWNQELAYYEGLKYKETVGDYHIFTLPNDDYEKDDFCGTSGAPILDSKGKLVALVSRGGPSFDGEDWIIKGIDLSQQKTIIDIECGII